MNEVKLTGKVLNCYISENTGALITKVAVPHDHIIGKENIRCESVFNTIMVDENAIKKTDVMQGDKVMITGHLKLDHRKSLTGNEHQSLKVYADEIEVVKPKGEFLDTTRVLLGIED